jgi:hypothetical protein
MSEPQAYHPLNSLEPATEEVWIVDARLLGKLSLPIRMTVVRIRYRSYSVFTDPVQ